MWDRPGKRLSRDSATVFTLSLSPRVMSKPCCEYTCAQPCTSLLLPCCPSCWAQPWPGHIRTDSAGSQGSGLIQAPRGHPLGSSGMGTAGLHPAWGHCHPLLPFSLTEQPISVTAWQHHVLGCPTDTDHRWLPIRLRFYKNSMFCRLSDRIHKAANMLAHCTRWSTAFHRVQQFPEASLSVCFKGQDIGYQPCKNTLWVKEIAVVFTARLVKEPLCCMWRCQETCGYPVCFTPLCFAPSIFHFLFSRKASATGGWKWSWFNISSKRYCPPTSEQSLELCPG